MTESVVGVVTNKNQRGTGIQIDGNLQWYNASPGILDLVTVGSKVKLEVNRKGTTAFVNSADVVEEVSQPVAVAAPKPATPYEQQQADRQAAIVYQSARNAAIELTGIALQADALSLPTKKADKWDALKAFVDELTNDFVTAVNEKAS